jgi:hypothetical protein
VASRQGRQGTKERNPRNARDHQELPAFLGQKDGSWRLAKSEGAGSFETATELTGQSIKNLQERQEASPGIAIALQNGFARAK